MNYLKQNSKNIIIFSAIALFAGFNFAKASYDKLPTLEADYQNKALQIEGMRASLSNEECSLLIIEGDLAKEKMIQHLEGKRNLTGDETVEGLNEKINKTCTMMPVDKPSENQENINPKVSIDLDNIQPKDLFYTFLVSDGAKVSQSPKEHFKANGYMATDIATNQQKLTTYAPSLVKDGQDQLREYTVKLAQNKGTTGETIELHWQENGVNYAWSIGHMNERWVKDGDVVKTGDQLGLSGGCTGELKLEEASTGCHVHIELRIDGQAVEYPFDNNSKHVETGRLTFGNPQPWTEGLV